MTYEVGEPIQNSPFEEPQRYWFIREGAEPELRTGRRPSVVYAPREGNTQWDVGDVLQASRDFSPGFEMVLVNRIRQRVQEWRSLGYPGVTRTTSDLLKHWQRPGREKRLFYAQLEAVETVIFLREARADLRQGITIPTDEPNNSELKAFLRYCCKLATGSGKTTVMAMLAAWSVLNKVNDRTDARFSDVVLVVCPNVTIRDRLQELNPENGEASLYRTRDIVPAGLMDKLRQGKVIVTNWHVFELRAPLTAGEPAKVVKVGVPTTTTEKIKISSKNETARGKRYLTEKSLNEKIALGMMAKVSEKRDKQGNLEEVEVAATRYVESEAAWIQRILGREIGNKQNILVFNDEAHHAYRIQPDKPSDDEDDELKEYEEKESTIWVEGLDRIHKNRGINLCVDLSATPFYLRQAGNETHKPFPWIVSDFSLMDAIESGLVKIPQLPVRDNTGSEIPGYLNIWNWVLSKLTRAERGGKRSDLKPEAVLKYAQTPIAMLGGLWQQRLEELAQTNDPRPPVFILVCNDTKIAKVIYEWLAKGTQPSGIPECKIAGFCNTETETYTLRVDSKAAKDIESGNAKTDEVKWMRFTLDTVGQMDWPTDSQKRLIYPEGFESLAEKLGKPLHPPGRDIRCIVSVSMLTEGWDCRTVTHVIGLRPFMSQLLCEQVVGRALRRFSYDLTDEGKFSEELAQILGVPFEIVPFKANPAGSRRPPEKRNHVYAIPGKAEYKIQFPRIEGYTQAIRNRVRVDWDAIAPLELDPFNIAPEVDIKGTVANNEGRATLSGPGKLENLDLSPFRQGRRLQELVFDLARDLIKDYLRSPDCQAPAHVLFPQLVEICDRYLKEKVRPVPPANILDAFLSPYYGWIIERLVEAIHPDIDAGEAPEIPRYETHRGGGSTDAVDFWTSKDVREVVKSHLNGVVADTKRWEQSAAFAIDNHPGVAAFVKNDQLGFAIPYLHNGQPHDYIPDFIIRLNVESDVPHYLILEIKGYDELKAVKQQAAERWCAAVNADGQYGHWQYAIAFNPGEVKGLIDDSVNALVDDRDFFS